MPENVDFLLHTNMKARDIRGLLLFVALKQIPPPPEPGMQKRARYEPDVQTSSFPRHAQMQRPGTRGLIDCLLSVVVYKNIAKKCAYKRLV